MSTKIKDGLSNKIEEENTKDESKKEEKMNVQQVIQIIIAYLNPFLKYIIMICFCIFIAVIFSKATFNKPDVVFMQKYTYLMMIFIPFLFLIYLFLRKDNSNLDPKLVMIIGTCIILIGIVVLISYYRTPSSTKTNSIIMNSYIVNLILLAIVIVGLAIGYKVLKNSTKKMKGWPGFIINVLFFIPCLVSDFVDYILSEFKNAPNSVFILFILEIILILLYIYIPKLLNYIITKNGKTLQKEPVYLRKPKIIENSDIFLLPNSVTSGLSSGSDILSNTYNSNFGISMWIYVNNMGSNIVDNKNAFFIFKTASPNDKDGKPCIRYIGNDQLNFIFNNNPSFHYTMKMPSQKWNHIVFNYYENNVDLFINGNLERNMNLQSNPINILPTDIISVGDDNGIDGAICNIVYYNIPLSQTKISQIYNVYFMKSPPL